MSNPAPNTPVPSPFTKLSFYFQSMLAYILEKKVTILWSLVALILVFSLCIFWMGRSSKQTITNALKANALVQQLSSPVVGEKQPPIPSYQEIDKTLSASRALQERYNGVLLEEAIVANQTNNAFSTFKKNITLFPMEEWPWTEIPSITNTLESGQYDKALPLIQTLLQKIQQKKQEPLFKELSGYLRLEEGACLQELSKSESQSSVQFDNWKKSYPDLAKQLITIADIEK